MSGSCRRVCGSPPGVADSTSIRWRVFNNAWCICTYHAPHAGLPQETRVNFWRGFLAVAQRVQNAVSVPVAIAGRQRLASSFQPLSIPIVRCANHPFEDLRMASCRLELCNPPDRATHISGAGLDCIFISCGHVVGVVVHDGLQCCASSPVCWGQHRSWSVFSHTSRPSAWTNVAAFARLETHFNPCARRAPSVECASQDLCQSSPPSRRQLLDGVFNEMIAILHRHAPAQRCHRRRRQPSWWTPAARETATHALLSIVSCTGVRISCRIGKRTYVSVAREPPSYSL